MIFSLNQDKNEWIFFNYFFFFRPRNVRCTWGKLNLFYFSNEHFFFFRGKWINIFSRKWTFFRNKREHFSLKYGLLQAINSGKALKSKEISILPLKMRPFTHTHTWNTHAAAHFYYWGLGIIFYYLNLWFCLKI